MGNNVVLVVGDGGRYHRYAHTGCDREDSQARLVARKHGRKESRSLVWSKL